MSTPCCGESRPWQFVFQKARLALLAMESKYFERGFMGDQRKQIKRKIGSSPQKSDAKSSGAEKPANPKSKSSPHFIGREADAPLTPGDMLYLQRTVGNRAVNRLVQAKLKIGQPGDAYEREADQVSERVMRMPEDETVNVSQTAGQQKPKDESQSQYIGEEEERKRPEESNMVQMAPEAAPAPVQHQQMLEDGRRKRQEDMGMVQMKEANASGSLQSQATAEEEERKRPEDAGMVQMKEASVSPPGQAMNPKDEENRKHMEEGQSVYAKEEAGVAPSASPDARPDVESQIESGSSGGEPLSADLRDYFEPRFGQDLSDVRIHKDAQASGSAKVIHARAYTKGKDIVLGAGEYSPETTEGKKLLAHELTHVIQQQRAGRRVQRYEAEGMSATGEKSHTVPAPTVYVVQKGDTLESIAGNFGVTVAALKQANKGKLMNSPATDGSGRMIEGFNAGETVSIPPNS
jgi:LysM repeat protein